MHLGIALLSVIFLTSLPFAFAQGGHHGGEQAPPVSFGDKQVTVSAVIEPADFIPGKDNMAHLKIRFFDSLTDVNIEHVTYRVQILRDGKLLANHMFFDRDGELDIKVQPVSGCQMEDLWRCTTYQGEMDLVVPNALTSSGNSIPIIRGPVFDQSGMYTLKVAIIGATNPRTLTAQDINFETHINIAQEQQFSLNTSGGAALVNVKAFQDKLSNFRFDETSKSISFVMPFHWEHAEHVHLVRNDIMIPKEFAPYQNVRSFKGTINGVPIFSSSLHYDVYSDKNVNTLHFVVSGVELEMIRQQLGTTGGHSMTVVITPDTEGLFTSTDVAFPNNYKASVSYDPRHPPSKDIMFTLAFFDQSGELASDIRYAFSVKDSSGNEFVQNIGSNPRLLGIQVPSGVDSRLITIPQQGSYTLQLVLIGRGQVNFSQFVPASLSINVSETLQSPQQPAPQRAPVGEIPPWIKNNAKWWADGTIGDSDFISGIQFLIQQNILKIPPTDSGGSGATQIPPWIKNNAKWWADGTIGDSDFISGIQFLVSQGIIRV